MYLIVTGNPIDGFEFVGPFDTREAAIEYADSLSPDWWLAEVSEPVQ